MSNYKNKSELKQLFEDGKVPSGEDFDDLIESLVEMPEFAELKTNFENLRDAFNEVVPAEVEGFIGRCLRFRHGNTEYVLGLDEANQDLKLQRLGEEKLPGYVGFDGWIGSRGRYGLAQFEEGEKKDVRLSSQFRLRLQPADGKPGKLLTAKGPRAVEVVAFVEGALYQKTKFASFWGVIRDLLSRLVGATAPTTSMVHATAVTAGGKGNSIVNALSQPSAHNLRPRWRKLSGLQLGFLGLIGFQFLDEAGLSFLKSGWLGGTAGVFDRFKSVLGLSVATTMDLGDFVITLIALSLVLILQIRSMTMSRGLHVYWEKKGEEHVLYLKAGPYWDGDENSQIQYHMTELWPREVISEPPGDENESA